MADGRKLRVDIVRPAVLGTSRTAAGKFPVLLTTTPYGKNNYAIDTHLVHRGHIEVIADIRGTGLSEGDFQVFAPAEVSDGVRLVGWVSKLQGSSGVVGLIGGSYLGTNQLLVAGAVGPHSALKAIFPVAAAHGLYRDVVTMGSIPDFSFLSVWLLGLLPSQNLTGPVIEALIDPATAPVALRSLLRNLLGDVNYNAALIADMVLTGNRTPDSQYWRGRSPRGVLDKIVANGIPAYLVGGAFDIFQRGEPLNFAGLQNAWAGRREQADGGPATSDGALPAVARPMDPRRLRGVGPSRPPDRLVRQVAQGPVHGNRPDPHAIARHRRHDWNAQRLADLPGSGHQREYLLSRRGQDRNRTVAQRRPSDSGPPTHGNRS